MRSDYFVEFNYHDESLRLQNNYKFLLEKYRQNKEEVTKLKEDKMKEVDALIAILDSIELELKEFKKLIPNPPPGSVSAAARPEPEKQPAKPSAKTSKKKVKKKAKKPSADKKLDDLKLGLEKIRDELARM